MCNRVHLHIVFVLLYSVCHSIGVLSCVDVIQSFTYVLRVVILDVIKRRGERQRERNREAIPTASCMYHQKKRIKQEFLAVAGFLFITFNLVLPSVVYISIVFPFLL